jgi:hypothetical protein
MLLFLPFFGQKVNDTLQSVSLLSLNGIAPYLRTVYLSAVIGITVFGILILALQKSQPSFLNRNKYRISLILNAVAVSLFIISTQPYAAILLFIFLVIKGIMLIKHQ